MFLLIGLFTLGFVLFGVIAYSTVNTIKINGRIYHEIKRENDLLVDIAAPNNYLIEACYNSMRLVDEEKPEKIQSFIERLKKARANYDKSYEKWTKDLPEGEVKNLITVKSHQSAMEFLEKIDKELIPMVLEGKRAEATALSGGFLRTKFIEHRGFIDQAEELTRKNLAAHEADAASIVNWRTFSLILIAIFITAGVNLLGWFIVRSLVNPLSKVVEKLKAISQGDINQQFDYKSDDEIGMLADAFRSLLGYLNEVASVVESIGRGDLSKQIIARSENDLVSNNLKQAVTALQGLNEETQTLITAAKAGQLSARGDAGKFNGTYADLVRSVNQMLDAVVSPVNEASDCLQKLANRDLTVEMTGNYQGDFAKIKESLNTAVKNLDESLLQVSVGAEQVAAAAAEISSGSQLLAEGSTEQAATLEEVSANINEMVGVSVQNDSHAKSAQTLADIARTSADRGAQNMNLLSSAMDKIQESAWSTAKIVKTIEEIAFQTNLLALNAAVEAARAGDAGKGFAVVAEEVRALAMRSAEAARQTSQLIDESVKNTEVGVKHNEEVLNDLTEINNHIKEVSEMMTHIVSTSQQNHLSIEQINTAVEQMNGVTQQTAANSEEAASASEELSGQSRTMLDLIGQFNLSQKHLGKGNLDFSRSNSNRKSAAQVFQVNNGTRKKIKTSQNNSFGDNKFDHNSFDFTEDVLSEF